MWVDVASAWQVWEAFLQQKIYCELSSMLGFMQARCFRGSRVKKPASSVAQGVKDEWASDLDEMDSPPPLTLNGTVFRQ